MHAVFLTVRIEGDLDEAVKGLQEQVVPMVRSQPGFVAGYWFEAREGKGHSVVLFQTEEQARAAAPPPGSKPSPFATVETTDIRGVAANA
jgi:hypothetical protein